MIRNKSYLHLGRHFKNEAGFDGSTDGGSNQIEQQQAPEQTTSSNDAELLSAFLAQQNVDSGTENQPAQPQETPQPANDTYTVKINGQEKQVTRDELITHYQKGEASNQRFEEAAAIRREFEAKNAQTIQQREQLQNALNHFNMLAQQWQQEGQPDWNRLIAEDPHQYLIEKAKFDDRMAKIQQAQTAQAYLNQQQAHEQQQFQQQRLVQEGERLLEVIPEWKDATKRASEQNELVNFLSSKGFDAQRIEGLNYSDANTVKLAVSAMRYEKLVEQAKTATKQVQNLPPRMERAGVANTADNSGLSDAKQRLARSGSIEDATAAFAAMFG